MYAAAVADSVDDIGFRSGQRQTAPLGSPPFSRLRFAHFSRAQCFVVNSTRAGTRFPSNGRATGSESVTDTGQREPAATRALKGESPSAVRRRHLGVQAHTVAEPLRGKSLYLSLDTIIGKRYTTAERKADTYAAVTVNSRRLTLRESGRAERHALGRYSRITAST